MNRFYSQFLCLLKNPFEIQLTSWAYSLTRRLYVLFWYQTSIKILRILRELILARANFGGFAEFSKITSTTMLSSVNSLLPRRLFMYLKSIAVAYHKRGKKIET